MKTNFSIKKNLDLIPVFIPIILSLSSWTFYQVIHKKPAVEKIIKAADSTSGIKKNTADFLTGLKSKIKNIADENISKDSLNNKISDNKKILEYLPASQRNFSFSDYGSVLAKSGFIGEIGNKDSERLDANASDNIFDVELSDINPNKKYLLKYEVDGYSNINSVTRSVNGSFAVGGYIKSKKNGWSDLSEVLSPSMLKKGNNKILFNALNKGDYYSIKNVRIVESDLNTEPYTIVSNIYNDKVIYIRGFINPESGINAVEIEGNEITVRDNEFEYLSLGENHGESAQIKFKGSVTVDDFTIHKSLNDPSNLNIQSYDEKGHNIIFQNTSVTVKGLRLIDLPPADLSVVNISGKYAGYRVINSNDKEINVHIPFDEKKLPAGYTEKDITALTFDYEKRKWNPVSADSINTAKKYMILRTALRSADFMAGVIKQPESPETGVDAPTAFNDMPIANPGSKINLIAPPTPNQQGSANVSYPIEIPAGIGGFQPNVSLVYNSDNKFGWAGTGWDIPVETIDIDTRWGIPSFSSANESEVYLIAGEQLVFKDDYMPHKLPYPEARTSNRQFFYRNGIKEGYYITRKGSSPSSYTWEILDGSGTKKEYNEVLTTNPSGNSSGNVVKWFLSKVTDRFGNIIVYTYTDSYEGGVKINIYQKSPTAIIP